MSGERAYAVLTVLWWFSVANVCVAMLLVAVATDESRETMATVFAVAGASLVGTWLLRQVLRRAIDG